MNAKRQERIDRLYLEVKNLDHSTYERCVEYASGLALNHGLSTRVAAEIEFAFIDFAHSFLTGGRL